MNLVFIFWGHYDGFTDALACAKARAACPITVISDGEKPDGVNYFPLSSFEESARMVDALSPHIGRWASLSMARWFVLRELGKRQPELFPVFCSDWDVMIFRNLQEAYAPFEKFDYTVSVNEGGSSAAYGVNQAEALDSFCEHVAKALRDGTVKTVAPNDMEAWATHTRSGPWKAGNLFEIQNGAVFDHSMHAGSDRFVMDGPAKKIVYQNGQPYFVLHGGSLIVANTAHCWSTYKTRTGEVLRKCGIKTS